METEKIIELRDALIYQQETLVLSNVNFSVNKGEFVYLLGKTGSGKSSLLKTLYGDLHVAGGSGTIAGFDLKAIKENKLPYLRRKLGIVFQDFQLLTDRNVEANLQFVLHATGWKDKFKMKERIDDVLNMVGLGTKGFKMPHQLSGGEQQRVVVARALLNHPEVILADEPTGNLDPDTSEEIMELLLSINRKAQTAIVFASHDMMTIEKFPARTVRCENGKLIEQSPAVTSAKKEERKLEISSNPIIDSLNSPPSLTVKIETVKQEIDTEHEQGSFRFE